MSFVTHLLSEEGIAEVFQDSADDLKFGAAEALFFKNMAAVFHDFSERVQKLVWKQEGTKFTTYPTGTCHTLTWAVLGGIKKTAQVMDDFGTSLDNVNMALNNSLKKRNAQRQKLYTETNTILNQIKNSKHELDKKQKQYRKAAKACENAILNPVDTTKFAMKKLKPGEARVSLNVATKVYEYQLELTNKQLFEAYNVKLPKKLQEFEDLKREGLLQYGNCGQQINKNFKEFPFKIRKAFLEMNAASKNFCAEESLDAYITICDMKTITPKPYQFKKYKSNVATFPNYAPKVQEDFHFTEPELKKKVYTSIPISSKKSSNSSNKEEDDLTDEGISIEEDSDDGIPLEEIENGDIEIISIQQEDLLNHPKFTSMIKENPNIQLKLKNILLN